MIESFLLGVVTTASLTAGLFFLRFWIASRDFLFVGFAVFFLVEGLNRIALLFVAHPNEGNPWIYSIRLCALLLLLGAILNKNYGKKF
jgi:uncharacterized membrane protein HdeD (DUF308 family)